MRISIRNLSEGNTTTGSLFLEVSHQLKRTSLYKLPESITTLYATEYIRVNEIFSSDIYFGKFNSSMKRRFAEYGFKYTKT